MAFKVQIELTLVAKDAARTAVLVTELPFVPFVGMRWTWAVSEPEDEEETWIDVQEVEWSAYWNGFVVRDTKSVFDNCCCKPEDGCCTLSYLTSVWIPEGQGWELDDPRPLTHREAEMVGSREGWPELAEA